MDTKYKKMFKEEEHIVRNRCSQTNRRQKGQEYEMNTAKQT